MNSDEFAPAPTSPIVTKKSNSKGVAIAVVVIVLLIGGFLMFRGLQSKKEEVKVTPTVAVPTEEPTPTEEATPSATPTKKPTTAPTKGPVESAADMNIQVQNGSGEAGVAGTAKDYLASKGYKNLETGNADNFDYTGVTIKIKSSMNKYLSTLKSDLQAKYTVNSETGTLPADSTFDALVIVGK